MANNVAITAGAGTDIATDDVSSVHFQKVKLDLGGNGASDPVVADIAGKVPATAQGNVAHDAADSGGPVKVGHKAIAFGANPTAVAASDRTDWYANRHGIPFVLGGHPNAKSATYVATGAGTDDNILPAISAGTKYGCTKLTITLGGDGTANVELRIGWGASVVPALGATLADAVDGILFYHKSIVPGSVITIGDGTGLLGVGGDGEELRATFTAPTGTTLAIIPTYFTIES